MTANAASGADFLVKPPIWAMNIMVPLKHTSALVVPGSGPARLYFRTPEDLANYQTKTLTLPSVNTGMTADKWIGMQDSEYVKDNVSYTLVYSATVYARGKPSGWKFDSGSLDFLKALVKKLDLEQRVEVLSTLQLNLSGPEARGHMLSDVLREFGLN